MRYLILATLLFTISFLPVSGQDLTYKDELKQFRDEYKKGFINSERSPLEEKDLKHLRFFIGKQKFVLEAVVKPTPQAKPFEMPTYSGITKQFKMYAELHFEIKGRTYQLNAYQNLKYLTMDKDHLFVPFKDFTNDGKTYGGGRYMDLKISEIEDGMIVLDFNKAYNPWCAYSDGFNCPIPPLANHLNTKIKAGERMYAGLKKKVK